MSIHSKLVDWGYTILQEEKKCQQIEKEYRVFINNRQYVIDIVGMGARNIAVECVDSSMPSKQKIEDLQSSFDEVFVLTTEDLVQYYEEIIVSSDLSDIIKKRESLENEVGNLRDARQELTKKVKDLLKKRKELTEFPNYTGSRNIIYWQNYRHILSNYAQATQVEENFEELYKIKEGIKNKKGDMATIKICQDRAVHFPKNMMLHTNAKIGDSLEFYPATMRVDEAEMDLNDMVLVKVKKE